MKKRIISTLLMLSTGFATTTFAAKPVVEQAGEPTFQGLLKEFPKGSLPYTLSADALKHAFLQEQGLEQRKAPQKVPQKRISSKYNSLLPDMKSFGRMPSMPEAVIALESKTHYALIYTTDRYSIKYKAAIYDKEGTFLYKMPVAHAHYTEIQSFNLDEDLKATFATHTLTWEKDVEKEGYMDNHIKSINLQKTIFVDMTIIPESSEDAPVMPDSRLRVKKNAPAQVKKQPAIIRA